MFAQLFYIYKMNYINNPLDPSWSGAQRRTFLPKAHRIELLEVQE
jgi:hypothetical protein